MDNQQNSTNINWYPGHMAKARRQMQEKIDLVDIIYEVIDARIPFSSKIIDIDNLILNKPKIMIMAKYDLCDKDETNQWIQYYKAKGYLVFPCDLTKENICSKILSATDRLLGEINQKRILKGMKPRIYRAMVVGIPNVGKSTLINQLVGKKAVHVGNRPGVTKSLDWIRINKEIELLDTPGILWPKIDSEETAYNLAVFTAIKEEILPLDKVSFYILSKLKEYYPDILQNRYKIDNIEIDDTLAFYEIIGKNRGALTKGGEIDYDKVATLILNDIKNGVIKNITFDRMV